jgi:hypothetical protein
MLEIHFEIMFCLINNGVWARIIGVVDDQGIMI